MISKRLVLVLLAALLVPAAAWAAAPAAAPSPAPAASPAWLGGSAACAEMPSATPAASAQGARTPTVLPTAPFAQRQNDSGSCGPGACDDFCNSVCAPCGGIPASQCTQTFTGGCRAICSCYVC